MLCVQPLMQVSNGKVHDQPMKARLCHRLLYNQNQQGKSARTPASAQSSPTAATSQCVQGVPDQPHKLLLQSNISPIKGTVKLQSECQKSCCKIVFPRVQGGFSSVARAG